MAEISQSSDPPPSISSFSPELANPVKTLDESSPTAPIRALVVNSLALSSPIRQIQSQASSPAKPLIQIRNPAGSSSSSPSDKTLISPSSVNIKENESRDSQIMPQAQISPDKNKILQLASTSYPLDANRDSYNRPPRRYMANYDYLSDDDLKIESTKPVEFSWSCPKIEPTGVVSSRVSPKSNFVFGIN